MAILPELSGPFSPFLCSHTGHCRHKVLLDFRIESCLTYLSSAWFYLECKSGVVWQQGCQRIGGIGRGHCPFHLCKADQKQGKVSIALCGMWLIFYSIQISKWGAVHISLGHGVGETLRSEGESPWVSSFQWDQHIILTHPFNLLGTVTRRLFLQALLAPSSLSTAQNKLKKSYFKKA